MAKAKLSREEVLARQAEKLPPREMSEKQFQAWCVVRARRLGWTRQFHILRAQVKGVWVTNTSVPGVPDLWLLRPPRLVVLEIKRWGGKPTPEQSSWIAGLQRVPGIDAYVVSPADAEEVLDLLAIDPPPTPGYTEPR